MKRKKDKYFREDVNQLFVYAHILNILSNFSSFKKWLKENHKLDNNEGIVKGYAYNILICIRCVIDSIRSSTRLGLSDDSVLYRANFKGIILEELPNTCEKIIFLKKIWFLSKKLLKVNSWEDIEEFFNLIEPLIRILNILFNKKVKTEGKISKNLALKTNIKYFLLIFNHDITKGYPKGACISGIIDDKPFTNKTILKESYIGYTYSLQYVWYQILESEYENSALRNLHLVADFEEFKKIDLMRILTDFLQYCNISDFNSISKKLFPSAKLQITHTNSKIDTENLIAEALSKGIDEILHSMFSDNSPERTKLLRLIKQTSTDEICNKIPEYVDKFFYWEPLDKYFGIVKDEFYSPPINLYMRHIDLQNFINRNEISFEFDGDTEVSYFNKEDDESIFKRIDFDFLWYELDILDTQKSNFFNGVPAFLSVINGLTLLVQKEVPDEKIRVITIKHPHPSIKNAFDYSFSVLVPITGIFTDSSGWLVFYDCAGDYSGTAGDMYKRAMLEIIKLLESKKIIYKEVIINKEVFKRYIPTKAVSSVFDSIINFEGVNSELLKDQKIINLTDINKRLEYFVNHTRGKLFEFLIFKWLSTTMALKDIQCDIVIEGEQYDCLLFEDESIVIYECKINLHDNLESYLIQARKKESKLVSMYPSRDVRTSIAVYYEVEPRRKNLLKEKGLDVIDNFRRRFEISASFAGTIKEIRRVLEKF